MTVRASLALNPALPDQVSAVLAVDTDARVRAILSRKLSTLTPDLTGDARRRVQRDAVANLTAMVADAALRARIAIAEAVKDLADGPRDIVLRLAHDPAVMVCEPVIRLSPMLTQEDLVTLIATGPPPSTLMAVAQSAQDRCHGVGCDRRHRRSARRSARCWPTRPRKSAKPRWTRWPRSPRNRPTGKPRW